MRDMFDRMQDRTKTLALLAAFLVGFGGLATAARAQQALPLGTEMPMATAPLERAGGGQATLGGLGGQTGTAVLFWSNQCPWVDKYQDRVAALIADYRTRGVSFVLVNSNDPAAYPQESAQASRDWIGRAGLSASYLLDPTSELARAFGAERAPHVFLFDADDTLVYVGAIDDSPGDPGNVREAYLDRALSALVAGQAIAVPQTKAFGCTIKVRQ